MVILVSMHVQPAIQSDSGEVDHLSYLIPLYERVSTLNSIMHINVAQAFSQRFDSNDLSDYFLDDVHLTERGAAFAASIVLENLSNISLQQKMESQHKASSSLPESSSCLDLIKLITGTSNEFTT